MAVCTLLVGCEDSLSIQTKQIRPSSDKASKPSRTRKKENALKSGVKPIDAAPIDIVLKHEYYDHKTGLLSVHVTFQNRQKKPIYLVANQWAFLKGAPGTPGHRLAVQKQEGRIVLDLSHLAITESFWNALHEVGYATWSYSETIKIKPEGSHRFVLAFQFPLILSSELSEVETVEAPENLIKVQFKFGWANEDLEDFVQREFFQKEARHKKDRITKDRTDPKEVSEQPSKQRLRRLKKEEQQILTKWQKTVLTDPIEIDFSNAKD